MTDTLLTALKCVFSAALWQIYMKPQSVLCLSCLHNQLVFTYEWRTHAHRSSKQRTLVGIAMTSRFYIMPATSLLPRPLIWHIADMTGHTKHKFTCFTELSDVAFVAVALAGPHTRSVIDTGRETRSYQKHRETLNNELKISLATTAAKQWTINTKQRN